MTLIVAGMWRVLSVPGESHGGPQSQFQRSLVNQKRWEKERQSKLQSKVEWATIVSLLIP